MREARLKKISILTKALTLYVDYPAFHYDFITLFRWKELQHTVTSKLVHQCPPEKVQRERRLGSCTHIWKITPETLTFGDRQPTLTLAIMVRFAYTNNAINVKNSAIHTN